MGTKTDIQLGEYLYRYFKKRSAALSINLYKSGLTKSDRDIHKTRVEVKKIVALFSFFDLLNTEDSRISKFNKIFKKIFSAAGNIRDTQIVIDAIRQINNPSSEFETFLEYLKKLEKRHSKSFVRLILAFDDKKLKSATQIIKEICGKVNAQEISERCKEYILKRSTTINQVLPFVEQIENLHTIRKEMKKISAISKLLSKINDDSFVDHLNCQVSKVESEIGVWHDKVILVDSLTIYLDKQAKNTEEHFEDLINLRGKVSSEASVKIIEIMPMILEFNQLINENLTKM